MFTEAEIAMFTEQRRWEISVFLRNLADSFMRVDFQCPATRAVGEATEHCWMLAGHNGNHTNHEGEQFIC